MDEQEELKQKIARDAQALFERKCIAERKEAREVRKSFNRRRYQRHYKRVQQQLSRQSL